MPIRQAIAELLDEVRMTRKALQGLRRDLKRRHDAEQAERQAGEVFHVIGLRFAASRYSQQTTTPVMG